MTKITLSVEHMLLTGLSIHRGCRETIDEIYNEKPTVYYERYLNSNYRDDIIKRIFTMESEEKFNQLVGILDASLKEEYRKFEELKNEQEEAFNAQQRELEQLRQKVKALEVENKKMQVAQEKAESHIKSLEAEAGEVNESFNNLKTQLVETQQRLSSQSTLSLDEKVAFLNRYRIGMFGGRQNIRELSNTIENISFYDALNEDLSSIQGLDVVFMNTDYINHAFTSKIRSMSEKLGIPTRYITGVNRELLIGTMYEELQSFEK